MPCGIAIATGVPSVLGMAVFGPATCCVSRGIFDIPPVAHPGTSGGCFLLGLGGAQLRSAFGQLGGTSLAAPCGFEADRRQHSAAARLDPGMGQGQAQQNTSGGLKPGHHSSLSSIHTEAVP